MSLCITNFNTISFRSGQSLSKLLNDCKPGSPVRFRLAKKFSKILVHVFKRTVSESGGESFRREGQLIRTGGMDCATYAGMSCPIGHASIHVYTDDILNRRPNQPKKTSISAPDIQDRLRQRKALVSCIFPCTPYISIGYIVQAE